VVQGRGWDGIGTGVGELGEDDGWACLVLPTIACSLGRIQASVLCYMHALREYRLSLDLLRSTLALNAYRQPWPKHGSFEQMAGHTAH
jgi:hypothetical protein